ncbi:hypothetical protein [Enemella evansiae]|uniref:hypothetical protein n=1 Tax=Enemella evansiae TaxID=2016499 RepID=UPI00117F970C|nr:hypothetical protein [Enemella evansiae]
METRHFPRTWRTLLVGLAVLITAVQVVRPGINQDVRYVLGGLQVTAGAGLGWSETWVHRPLLSRGLMALIGALSPGEYWTEEIMVRLVSILLAVCAGVLLYRSLRRWAGVRGAEWIGLAATAALAWAPGWDFAEPEWYAAALAVLAIGVALARDRSRFLGPLLAGLLLAVVVLLKFTTAATALAAILLLAALDRRLALRTAVVTAVGTLTLFGITIAVEPREWQWLQDMPALNPPLTAAALAASGKGLVNELVVSPIIVVALVAQVWLWHRGGSHRRWALGNLLVMAILTVPFLVQHQNFLYHLAALPVFSAVSVATIAHRAIRAGDGVPIALPITAALGFAVSCLLFVPGTSFRTRNSWLALAGELAVVAVGVLLVYWQPSAFREIFSERISSGRGWMAMCCLLPLVVTLSPRATYSFSLAHRTVTPAVNLTAAKYAGATAERVHHVLPPDSQVIYLAFNTQWVLRNPTPCRYASPTFLQRATGKQAAAIEATQSFAENLACLSNPRARYVVIEESWFDVEKANPLVTAALANNFDCERRIWAADGLVICPRR